MWDYNSTIAVCQLGYYTAVAIFAISTNFNYTKTVHAIAKLICD